MNIEDLYTVEKHESGAEMQVKDENGKKLDMYITIAGIDSKLFRKVKSKLRSDILSKKNIDADKLKENAVSDITLGWRGFLSGETELEFSREKVLQLYQNAPYVLDQVDEFCNDRTNFTKG